MNLTNDRYTIVLRGRTWAERYYRDEAGWVKESTRGRIFRATAEQVLNHLLPALAGLKPNVMVSVEHHDHPTETKGPVAKRKRGRSMVRPTRQGAKPTPP